MRRKTAFFSGLSLLSLTLAVVPAAALMDPLASVALSTTTGLNAVVALDNQNTIHVAYYDPGDEEVKYLKRVNGEAVWRSTQSVDSLNNAHSTGTAMAVDSGGRPHVVFYDADDQALKYTRHTGSSWLPPVAIEAFVSTAPFPSLALNASGNPRVLYNNTEDTAIKLGISNDSGASWNTFTVIAGTMAAAGDITVDSNGIAHVVFNAHDPLNLGIFAGSHVLGYGAESAAGSGSVDGTLFAVSGTTGDSPGNISLALGPDDLGHISAFNSQTTDLWYVRGTTSSVTITTVPVSGVPRPDSAVVVASGSRPRIAFFEEGAGLRLAECSAGCATPGNWSTPASSLLDATVADGAGVSVVRNALNSVFTAYFSGGFSNLRFATNAVRGLQISGVVRDGNLSPLQGITVSLTGNIASSSMVTPGTGDYLFTDLLEGGYVATPSFPGYGFQPRSGVFSAMTSSSGQDFVGGPVGFSQVDNLIDPTRGEQVEMTVSVLDGRVFVGVYALNGRLVRTLLDEVKTLGSYLVTWDGRNEGGEAVASGIYLVRVETSEFNKIEKVAVVK